LVSWYNLNVVGCCLLGGCSGLMSYNLEPFEDLPSEELSELSELSAPPAQLGLWHSEEEAVEEERVCSELYPEPSGEAFYVDPVHGDDGNAGTSDAPWASLQVVVDQYVDCTDQYGTPRHSSAPVKGGDRIVLRGAVGYEEPLQIKSCYNEEMVHIVSEVHREPRIGSVRVKGAGFWSFEGLTMSAEGGQVFKAEGYDSIGFSHHIRVHDNAITSGELETWSDYSERASTAVKLSRADHVDVTCNRMERIAGAVSVQGNYVDVLYNYVELFSRDAFVNSGSHNRYIGNRVYDSVKLNDGHHDDFFQSHSGVYPDTATEIVVAYNVFMNRYTDAQPEETHGPTQCIGAFGEGPRTHWSVYNNVCKTDHWHGITVKEAYDSKVVNNTVVGGGAFPGGIWSGWSTETSWISVSGGGNVVRNNLTSKNSSGGDHNIVVEPGDVYDLFVDWEGGDLRLKPDSDAVDAGTKDSAPEDDVRGTLRDERPDAGAYELATD